MLVSLLTFMRSQGVLKSRDNQGDQRDPDLVRTLKALSNNAKNEVWIVTERPPGYLPQFIRDVESLNLAEDRGTHIRPARRGTSAPELADEAQSLNALKTECLKILICRPLEVLELGIAFHNN